jgi:hypothetical protein
MRSADLIRFARDAATGNPLRASLLVLAMAIGVAAVVVLTALGRWCPPLCDERIFQPWQQPGHCLAGALADGRLQPRQCHHQHHTRPDD